MIVVPVKEGENIEKALKKFKRKFEKTGVVKELRARQQFDKPSLPVSPTGLSPAMAGFPKIRSATFRSNYAVHTPGCTHPGLGSSAFARRYLRNRSFFLFLRVLRCFSSPGSPPYVMDWRMDT